MTPAKMKSVAENWRAVLLALSSVGGLFYVAAIKADSVIKNAEKVPTIERAVIELQQAQLMQAERNAILESKVVKSNEQVLALLQRMAEKNDGRN